MPTTDERSLAPTAPTAPTPVARRALAPDLARGAMLLLIALAHTPWFLYTSDVGATLLHPADGGVADRLAQAFTIIVVDGRAYPLFALLFAYGIGQSSARQVAGGAGEHDARRRLRTRHLWLLGFGLVHAALLWQGDILGVYGLMGLLLVPLFLPRSDRVLKRWIAGLLALGTLHAVVMAALAVGWPSGDTGATALQRLPIEQADYLASVPLRLVMWAPGLVSAFVVVTLPAAFLVGLLASRHRVLEEPGRHLPLLRRTAVVGIAVGWGVGAAQALVHVGALTLPSPTALSELHVLSGFGAGLGYAAVFALIAHRIAARGTPPLPARVVTALGRRSLSGYLTQSLVFTPVLAATGLGLGAHLSSWSALLVAVATWLATLALAYALDRRGVPGPAEALLRRLTYRSAPGARPRAAATARGRAG